MGEAGLAEARRPVKQDMVDGLTPTLGGGNANLEVFFKIFLPDEVGQGARPEAVIEWCVFYIGLTGNNASDFSPPGWLFLPLTQSLTPKGRGEKGFYSTFTLPQGKDYFHLPE
jgi:hypothetical protein